jgi:hypothetical protein
MKFMTAFIGVAALMVLGCGLDGSYKLETGTYDVSGATSASIDQCGLLEAYQAADKVIGISVSDTTVTFNLANETSTPVDQLATATLESNLLTKLTAADYEKAYNDTSGNPVCVVRITREVVGDVSADNTAALTLSFGVTTVEGTCNGSTTDFAAVPCASTYEFTATKQP